MKYPPHCCEVCLAGDWRVLGKRTYSAAQAEAADPYTGKRLRVLFERWFPGASTVELECMACRQCGFVMYSPRPEQADVDAKYRRLEELGRDYGPAPFDSPGERKRSEAVLKYLRRHMSLAGVKDVLDYGGGDGRLMQAFRDAGMSSCTNTLSRVFSASYSTMRRIGVRCGARCGTDSAAGGTEQERGMRHEDPRDGRRRIQGRQAREATAG